MAASLMILHSCTTLFALIIYLLLNRCGLGDYAHLFYMLTKRILFTHLFDSNKPIGLLQQGKSTKDWHWGSYGPFGLLKIRTTFRTKSRTSTRFSTGWRPAESHQALTDPSFVQSMTPLYHAAILMGHLNFKGIQDSAGLESGPFFQQERDYLLSWDLAKPSTTEQNSLQLALCLKFLGWLESKLWQSMETLRRY